MPHSVAWLRSWMHALTTPIGETTEPEEFLTNYALDSLLDPATCFEDKPYMLGSTFRDFYGIQPTKAVFSFSNDGKNELEQINRLAR